MPIEFDDSRVDVGGVDDRRGRGRGGLAVGGGAGIVGVIVVILFQLLGGDPSQLQLPAGDSSASSGGQQETREQLQARCDETGATTTYTDCRMIKVYNVADQVWDDELTRRGVAYDPPRLAFFTNSVDTACGTASAQVGPFYCPGDQEIYFDLDFLQALQTRFGAEGEFAQAYILAHEFGHHLQTLLGTEKKVRAAQQRDPDQANRYSVAMELQADCYAGVWATLADRQRSGIDLTAQNIVEAQKAAEAVGDDRIQQRSQGRVDPESWTHGSAEQRDRWFTTGYRSGDIDSCDTFR